MHDTRQTLSVSDHLPWDFHCLFIQQSNTKCSQVMRNKHKNTQFTEVWSKKKKNFISKLTNLNLINNCLKVRRKCGIFNCCHKINMNKSATIFVCMNKISDDIILTKLLMLYIVEDWRITIFFFQMKIFVFFSSFKCNFHLFCMLIMTEPLP